MYTLDGSLITSETDFDQLGHPFILFDQQTRDLLIKSHQPLQGFEMTHPAAWQIKENKCQPWVNFIPRRKSYDKGCLLYLVEADPFKNGNTCTKIGLTLENDPIKRDPAVYTQILSTTQIPAGINPLVVERLTLCACRYSGMHDLSERDWQKWLTKQQSLEWGGRTELLPFTNGESLISVFNTISNSCISYLKNYPETAALSEWNRLSGLWDSCRRLLKEPSAPINCGLRWDPYFGFEIKLKASDNEKINRRLSRQLKPHCIPALNLQGLCRSDRAKQETQDWAKMLGLE